MMQHKKLASVALIITAAWASTSFAEQSPAAAQCTALVNQKKLAEAEPYCAKAAEEPGKDGKLLYALFLSHQGDPESAMLYFSEILQGVDLEKPTKTEYSALRNRAIVGFYTGEYTADGDAYAALKLNPNDVELLQVGAQGSPSDVQRIEYADRLVALDPKSVDAHVLRAYALFSANKPDDAFAAADTAAKLDPKSAPPHIALGYVYISRNDFVDAEHEFAAAARKAPNDPEPKALQAGVLVNLARYDDAIKVATAALKLNPNHAAGLRTRADARLKMGDASGALADFDAANKINPNDEWSDRRESAEKILEIQEAMQPESIAAMERDRQVALEAFKAHLHSTCGHYSQPDYEDNDNLNAYRECIKDWYRTQGKNVVKSLSRNVLDAIERFDATAVSVKEAEELQCSKMPKKSRCVPDSLYAHAAAVANIPNPKLDVCMEEFDRLNREVAVVNARINRNNALINTASFLEALATSLSAQ